MSVRFFFDLLLIVIKKYLLKDINSILILFNDSLLFAIFRLGVGFFMLQGFSLKRLISEVKRLECSLNISRFSLGGLNYWPLIRFQMNFYRKYSQWNYKSVYKTGAVSVIMLALIILLNFLRFYFSSLTSRKSRVVKSVDDFTSDYSYLEQRDVLIVALSKEHHAIVGGKRAAPLMDGIALSLPERSYYKLVLGASEEELNSLLIKGGSLSYQRAVKRRFENPYRQPKSLSKLCDTLGVLFRCWLVERKLGRTGLKINPEELLYRLDMIQAQKQELMSFLRSLSPKVVYMTSYTGRTFIVAAAKELGIPVVDVQHGGMHRFNVACTHWNYVPEGGYEFLPDFFWCWNDSVAQMVNDTISHYHQAITGGHPGYHFWCFGHDIVKENMSDEVVAGIEKVKRLSEEKPIVLVALQYGRDELLSSHVIEVFRETRNDYQWLFRMHPMGLDRKDELLDILAGSVDVELVDWASSMPLPYLLMGTSFLLTKSSTISREAIPFGIKSVFWSKKGAEIHHDIVEDGGAAVALNSGELKEILCSNDYILENQFELSSVSKQVSSTLEYLNNLFMDNRGTK
jgi:hypothetical protein